MPSKSKNNTQRGANKKSAGPDQDAKDAQSRDTKTRNAKRSKKPMAVKEEQESTNSSFKNKKGVSKNTEKAKKKENANEKAQLLLQKAFTPKKDTIPDQPSTKPKLTPPPPPVSPAAPIAKKGTLEKAELPPPSPAAPVPQKPVSREPTTPPSKEKAAKVAKEDAAPNKTTDTTTGTTTGTTTPSALSLNDKWGAEPVAQRWIERIEFQNVKAEFEGLQKMTVDVEKDCKKWKANAKQNQSLDYPALDAKLIKCPDASEYVNMTYVELPIIRNVFIGQIPKKGCEETFWKALFEARVTFMTILNDDTVDFFPNEATDHRYYGSMWVNNRRVEIINEDTVRYVIEILPNGCSNSLISTFTLIKNWKIETVHTKQSVVIKEILEMSNHMVTQPPDDSGVILSMHGAGRAGYFAALLVAVNRLDQKAEPNIPEIVRSIRSQRPKAVETITQYVSLYIHLFYYIKRKLGVVGDDKSPADSLQKKCIQLTSAFANALIVEMNAGKSTVTTITLPK